MFLSLPSRLSCERSSEIGENFGFFVKTHRYAHVVPSFFVRATMWQMEWGNAHINLSPSAFDKDAK